MTKKYHQLTEGERNQIYVLRKDGYIPSEIAAKLGRAPSTISRELKRNHGKRGYRPIQAQNLSDERRSVASSRPKMTGEIIGYIEEKLRLDWSPETISSVMKTDPAIEGSISHERIYEHVYEDRLNGGDLHTHLRHGRKKRRKRCNPSPDRAGRGHIKNRRDIDERPKAVETREEPGHWEIDTIVGKGHQGNAVTIVERTTRFTLIEILDDRKAETVTEATVRLLEPYKDVCLSITADNGKEFAGHEKISAQLEIDFYFAKPYHSWERGTNENTNGLIRVPSKRSTTNRIASR